jgi:hypothetical protein
MADSDSSTSTPTLAPTPAKDPAHELATEIGLGVLAALSKAAKEGRLPADLSSLGPALMAAHDADAALVARPGTAKSAPSAPPQKAMPGTRTIRVLLRGASTLANAPAGTDLARVRLAMMIVAVLMCFGVSAAALASGLF